MRCHVYRSSVREGLYVYVAAPPVGDTPDDEAVLDTLPAAVRRQLGKAERAMTLELEEGLRLGQEDVREVLSNLAARGFHVQMPRDIEPLVQTVADAATRRATGRGRD